MEGINDIKGISMKQLLYALITLMLGGGAGIGIEFSYLESKIQEYAQPAIDKTVRGVVDNEVKSMIEGKVYSVLDSTMSSLPSVESNDSISILFYDWYLHQKNVINVGIFVEGGRVLYKHIDGLTYVPAKDSSGNYFFLDPVSGKTYWCL